MYKKYNKPKSSQRELAGLTVPVIAPFLQLAIKFCQVTEIEACRLEHLLTARKYFSTSCCCHHALT